jgi:hypothetical protein
MTRIEQKFSSIPQGGIPCGHFAGQNTRKNKRKAGENVGAREERRILKRLVAWSRFAISVSTQAGCAAMNWLSEMP